MKLAALQLMQQKASKMEHPTSLENGEAPSESKSEDPPGPEAGSEEEGSSASGLAKVKELAETIASDDGTGGTVVPSGWVAPGCGVGPDLAGLCVCGPISQNCRRPQRWNGAASQRSISTADPRSREVIRNACKAVGSISSTAFDVRFNPDIFSPGKWGQVGRSPV